MSTTRTTAQIPPLCLPVLTALALAITPCRLSAQTFTNPVFRSQDPWVTFVNGAYYYSDSSGRDVRIRKSTTLSGLATAEPVVVWRAPRTGPNSQNVWSPEIHRIGGAWYIYYAADDGENAHHRVFVLQGDGSDPLGSYRPGATGFPAGELQEASNRWAIDPDVFTAADGKPYLVWSGWAPGSRIQCIYLAPMADPLHLSGPGVQIAVPDRPWETRTAPIEEGPVGYARNGVTYLTYSGSASWTTDYSVGLLINRTGRLQDPQAWSKTGPIFDHHGRSYGPGSVVFTPSPDGLETWVLYHGIDSPGCQPSYRCRDIRMQRMAWNADGSPLLGYPIDPGVPLPLPSGEGGILPGRQKADGPDRRKGAGNVYGWGDAYGDAAEGFAVRGLQSAGWAVRSASDVTQRAQGAGRQQIFRGNPNLESYDVSVRVRQLARLAASLQPAYGLIAAYSDAANYVELCIDARNRTLISRAVVDGKELDVNAIPLSPHFRAMDYHVLRVEKAGGQFRFYLDGDLLQERAIDLLNGQPGLVTSDCQADFHAFALTPH